ncbi:methyltransferase type 12 [Chelatococcus reniformis]|uniref:Methyltransferase type 12 n=1 Tax=Chelatococcus reniformis TaxID=1494448 RepID=A0A916XNU0_9HYPH|nr:class I SAM-dependent methyltransferase [Chelatococcus reniformis]GGC87560.1 methyltransferase type 12 [Chelatococcus reniformis]
MLDSIARINKNKAVFDDIYTLSDPRLYFSTLGALDYMIPDVAEPVIRQLLDAHARYNGCTNTVLDIGCSYGINAAIHRFPVNFASLRQRYARREMIKLQPEELIRLDRHFYSSWPDIGLGRFIGFDASDAAIGYANAVGLHANGVAADLETGSLSAADAAIVAPANVLLSTGAIGYVTHKTYSKLLDATASPPWIISFVLRMFPYDEFIAAFAERGMVTEKLAGSTFVQRRFRDEDEFERSLDSLKARGIDTSGFEADGLFQAELFVSRPAEAARALPIDDIVTVTSGRFAAIGARYVQVSHEGDTRIAMET